MEKKSWVPVNNLVAALALVFTASASFATASEVNRAVILNENTLTSSAGADSVKWQKAFNPDAPISARFHPLVTTESGRASFQIVSPSHLTVIARHTGLVQQVGPNEGQPIDAWFGFDFDNVLLTDMVQEPIKLNFVNPVRGVGTSLEGNVSPHTKYVVGMTLIFKDGHRQDIKRDVESLPLVHLTNNKTFVNFNSELSAHTNQRNALFIGALSPSADIVGVEFRASTNKGKTGLDLAISQLEVVP